MLIFKKIIHILTVMVDKNCRVKVIFTNGHRYLFGLVLVLV